MLPSLDLYSEFLNRKISQGWAPGLGKFVFVRKLLGISCRRKWVRQQ